MSENKETFDEFSLLPGDPKLRQGAARVGKYVQRFAKPSGDDTRFEWDKFKQNLDDRPDADIFADDINHQHIVQQQNTAGVMVDKIIDFMIKVSRIAITEDYKLALTARVKATFIEEKPNHVEGGLFNFYQEDNGNSVSFSYRLLFHVPDPNSKDYFQTLVSTITLKAKTHSKKTWWGLSHDSSNEYSADVDCMKLNCSTSFNL
ncbi:hypothetical protein RhiTH_009001 [Rhizoctonia solani]